MMTLILSAKLRRNTPVALLLKEKDKQANRYKIQEQVNGPKQDDGAPKRK